MAARRRILERHSQEAVTATLVGILQAARGLNPSALVAAHTSKVGEEAA
jgi:hypothetical protein